MLRSLVGSEMCIRDSISTSLPLILLLDICMGPGQVTLIHHDCLLSCMSREAGQYLRPPAGLSSHYRSNKTYVTEEALSGTLVVAGDGELVLHKVLDLSLIHI
eukprot:TRINITY_DN39330_c0_g1_i1.p1 TRINITY_DN39330_c0_g1~~TRINITY_DN39330_c0_g1_i1.p1  ORF type:complete len:103 (+),score=13.73 TRINITY_DN39330_c0_g1_i1:133-441(+)